MVKRRLYSINFTVHRVGASYYQYDDWRHYGVNNQTNDLGERTAKHKFKAQRTSIHATKPLVDKYYQISFFDM